MGMAMMTSSQACTVPARHRDMGTVRASSTCCSLSSCSSQSDRLTLKRAGLERLSESGLVDVGRKGRAVCKRPLGCNSGLNPTKLYITTWIYWAGFNARVTEGADKSM